MSGHYFAEGVCIGMNPYVTNRHKPTWGEDAEFWRPERWLVDDHEQRKKLEGSLMTVSLLPLLIVPTLLNRDFTNM